MIYQTARFQVKPDTLAICQQAIHDFIKYIRANEPATLVYVSLAEQGAPTKFLHVFIFADQAARDRHANSDGVKKFTSILYPNCVAPVEFTEYTFVAAK